MNKHSAPLAFTRIAMAASMVMGAGSATALEFEFGDGWKGNWNTTLAAASSWRASTQDPKLFSAVDGAVRGFTGGLGASKTDSGNLNYDKGDAFSRVLKFTTDLSLSKGDTGGFIRVKGWYDDVVLNDNVRFGNQGQRPRYGYTPTTLVPPVGTITLAPLGTDGMQKANQGKGVELMDAYVYTSFDAGGLPAQLRIGNQVINWGESLFMQGVNVTSPIDVPALRRGAGTEIKEFLVPVPMLYGNLGLPAGMSLEAFYQAKWKNTVVDGCGSYFSQSEGVPSYQIGNCDVATALSPVLTNGQAVAAGSYFRTVAGKEASDSGQFGLALRFPINAIDTEFGVYYQQLHSRTPIISVLTGQPLPAPNPLFLPGGSANAAAAVWEYPEDMKILGVSASTTLAGWSTGFELSYTKDIPAQINGNDLVAAFVQGIGPVGLDARTLAGRVPGTPAAPIGTIFHGYDLFNKVQLQANGVQLFSNVLGATNLTVLGEIGFQWNNIPDYRDGGRRYGRGFIFGNGTHPTIAGGADLCTIPVAAARNPHPDGCTNDGYVTRFSMGTRLRGGLTYNDVFGSGITATPSLFWAHDVEGVSIDSQFSEGRDTLAFGLKLEYNKQYSLDLSYVTYANGAKWDTLRDRDFYSLGLSVTF